MGLSRSTAESGLGGITTADAKTHLRVTHTDDDTYIGSLILAATKVVEAKTKRQLITSTWVLTLDEWPEDDKIILPRAPLQSVTHIKYYDSNSVLQTMSSGDYRVIIDEEPGYVILGRNESWPVTLTDYPEVIVVTYVAGFGTTTSVPAALGHAIKLLVSHWYEHREAVDVSIAAQVRDVPLAVETLCAAYKVPRLP